MVEEVAGPRDICQAVLTAIFPSGVLQQLFECLPQSLPTGHYVLNKDVYPKGLVSENNAIQIRRQPASAVSLLKKTPASCEIRSTTVVWPHAIHNCVPVGIIHARNLHQPDLERPHSAVFTFSLGIEQNPTGMCCAACY